jgi:hypothetical protein
MTRNLLQDEIDLDRRMPPLRKVACSEPAAVKSAAGKPAVVKPATKRAARRQ